MLDAVTLDQLRVLVTVVEEGSFSRAARRLRRVQSAVSQAMAKLESQLGVTVWSREGRLPVLTADGRVVLAAARRVLAEADALGSVARGLAGGVEAHVALCVDAIFPTSALVELCRGFVRAHPAVELRVYTETLSDVVARVREGACQLGVVGPAAEASGLVRQHLTSVRMVPVAGGDGGGGGDSSVGLAGSSWVSRRGPGVEAGRRLVAVRRARAVGRVGPRPASGAEWVRGEHERARARGRRLAQLIRYVARPAFAEAQVEVVDEEQVRFVLRSPSRSGQHELVLHPLALLRRLAWLVPPPRQHQVRAFGVLAPAARLRPKVVPVGRVAVQRRWFGTQRFEPTERCRQESLPFVS